MLLLTAGESTLGADPTLTFLVGEANNITMASLIRAGPETPARQMRCAAGSTEFTTAGRLAQLTATRGFRRRCAAGDMEQTSGIGAL